MATLNHIIAASTFAIAAAGASHAEGSLFIEGGINSTTVEQSTSRNTGTNEPTTGPAGGPSITVTDRDTGASIYVSGGYEYDFTDKIGRAHV